ncbi:hypothetical protein JYT13_00820 [Mariprofundus ferrooxydans]|nr:hypothetical protein [Mariprofundus ferrooxydans]
MKFQTTLMVMITAMLLFLMPKFLVAGEQLTATVTEEDIEYTPEEQTVHVGQLIRMVNKDPFEHKSRITEQLEGGKLGYIALKDHLDKPGVSYTFTLDKEGTYEVRCMLHDGMTATIKAVK